MKALPTNEADKKLFLISLGLAFIVNLGQIMQIGNSANLIGYIINLLLTAIVIMIIIRVVVWIAKKAGITK